MHRYLIVFLLIEILLLAVSANAQNIRGTILDQNQVPVPEAHIMIKGTSITGVSDNHGNFDLHTKGLKKITLIATKVGFEPVSLALSVQDIRSGKIEMKLKEKVYKSETVVVTATRTRRDIEEVSIPVSVISGKEINNSGSMRLSDVLSEQVGMQIVQDHGQGIQVQGFDPDYTLIMIDGNPVIGRTAGTLDLSRISVRNVKQVEIVKGPSSALWGSDALAGVVNIITEKSNGRISGGIRTRYGENNTLDASGDVAFNTKNWSNNLFLNRNSSSGYSLNPSSVSQTVPEYENYTLSYNTSVQITDNLELDNSARFFTESQQNQASVTDGILSSDSDQSDFSVNPKLNYRMNKHLNLNIAWLFSRFQTESVDRFVDSGSIYEESHFKQYYNKPELQAGYRWDDSHHSMLGAGLIFEQLDAERYPNQPAFQTRFIFGQHSWMPSKQFELTGGLRFDTHSEYSSQVSPKFSARYKFNDFIQFRTSFGRGFKAPEFRQLFLDFTNSTAGYSVYGVSTVLEGVQQQVEEGNISQVLVPLETLGKIKAESSWALNVGFDLDPSPALRFRINAFRNSVDDLIETAPVARRTNGQSVFTYFNVDEVYTQGFETEVRFTISDEISGSAGYQFLDARRKIERDRTIQNEQGEVVEVTEVSYRPMFNRSKHSGNVKLFYESANGWGANIRGTLRGQYGLNDANGNGFVNPDEYEKGYSVWNIALSKRFRHNITLRTGIDNLLGHTDTNQPYLSGRLWYTQLAIEF